MKALIRCAMLMAALLAGGCTQATFKPPERNGPLALVESAAGRQLWLATVQEETRSRHVGGGSRRIGSWVSERYHHLRLQAHDPATARRLWLRELRVLRDKDGGAGAQVRILGQQGDVVWVWVHDQAVALSAGDGALVADGAALEQANPGIAGVLPKELQYYAWTGELVVTLADARRMRIEVPGFRATPYEVEDESRFSHARSMSATWNGTYGTNAFGVRHGRFGDAWIGLLSEKEARAAEHDPRGDHYADSADIDDERDLARRTFWRATTAWSDDFLKRGGKDGVAGFCEDRISSIENQEDMQLLVQSGDIEDYARRRGADPATHRQRMRECTEGFDPDRYRRIASLQRVPGAGEWLQGRMLKAQAEPGAPQWVQRGVIMKPAVRPPLMLDDPAGVLVLHRTRMDALGKLAIDRVDARFRPAWSSELPYQELANRWELPGRLLLYGSWDASKPDRRDIHEGLVSLDLASGRWQGWDVGVEETIPQP